MKKLIDHLATVAAWTAVGVILGMTATMFVVLFTSAVSGVTRSIL